MEDKLNLNWKVVDEARNYARKIASDTQEFIDKHTTVTVERTICRLLGIDGVDEMGVPLPNVVVDNIEKGHGLSFGAAMYIGNAMVNLKLSPQEIAEKVAKGELDLTKLKMAELFEIKAAINPIAKAAVEKISSNRKKENNI